MAIAAERLGSNEDSEDTGEHPIQINLEKSFRPKPSLTFFSQFNNHLWSCCSYAGSMLIAQVARRLKSLMSMCLHVCVFLCQISQS